MSEHRQNMNIAHTMNMIKYITILANMGDCYFFINHSFNLTLFFFPSR